MKNVTLMAVASLALATGAGKAQEKKLTHAQIPAAAAATLDRETKGSTVKGFSTEKDKGKILYEAATVVAGHTRDISVGADGTLVEVEEEIAMTSLPQQVQDALTVKAKGAEITKIETLTKKTGLVAYEAATLKNGKKGEIQVGPKGETLLREE